MSLLVTGSSGFLGSHILRRARALGYDAIGTSRDGSTAGAVLLDLCNRRSVDAALDATAPSIVIHCAAYGVNYADQDFDRALEINVRGSLHVLSAAARVRAKKFVHVGSAVEYGSYPGPIDEGAALKPTAVYGSTKAAATLLIQERARALQLPLLIVRPFATWGPGEGMHHLIPQVVAACLEHRKLQLTPCEVMRDYTYVEDVADDILALATAAMVDASEIVNIGSGSPTLLRDFVLSVAGVLGGESLMDFGALPYRSTEMHALVADTRRSRHILGHRPRTSIAEGVRRMILRRRPR